MAGTPAPPVVIPATVPFLPKWIVAFADNQYQNIVEGTFRTFATDVNGSFVKVDELNTNMVRGGLSLVPYTATLNGQPSVPTNLLGRRFTILGMDVRCVNGTGQTETAAGVKADPIDFRLLRSTTGVVDALVDILPTTTATVKAHWVRTSGTDAQKVASYLELPIEDQNVYRGEVYQYTFENLTPAVTRLVEIKQDMTMFSHPLPTGEDDDPYYKNFAPLSGATYDDSQLRELIAVLQTGKLDSYAVVSDSNEPTGYPSFGAALAAQEDGGTMQVRGAQPNLRYTKNGSLEGFGATMGLNFLAAGGFPASANAQTATLVGFNSKGRVVVIAQAASVANKYTFRNMTLEDGGYFEYYAPGVPGGGLVDTLELINCKAYKTVVVGNAFLGDPIVVLRCADGRPVRVIATNCDFQSTVGCIFGGHGSAGTQLVYRGTSVLVPAPGRQVQEVHKGTLSSSALWTNAEIVVDERTATATGVDPAGIITRKVSTSDTQLTLEQTGDTYGGTRLELLSREGSAGARFTSIPGTANPAGLDLVDFAFVGSSGAQKNLRFEHRSTDRKLSTNTTGEFQFLEPAPSGVAPAITHAFGAAGTYVGTELLLNGRATLQNQSEPATPSGGGVLYVEGGALKYKGSSGSVTTIANA